MKTEKSTKEKTGKKNSKEKKCRMRFCVTMTTILTSYKYYRFEIIFTRHEKRRKREEERERDMTIRQKNRRKNEIRNFKYLIPSFLGVLWYG